MTPKQLILPEVLKQRDLNGIEMGVLSDGTAFLTARGLAVVCGVAPSKIIEFTGRFKWSEVVDADKEGRVQNLLTANGYKDKPLYIEVPTKTGKIHAHPDVVCMAMLEYYAFEAGPNIKPVAVKNFRLLARRSLRDFIYSSVGYDPQNKIPLQWRQFHDRVQLNLPMIGYFNVFGELSGMVVELIRNGLAVDQHTVPDISVGKKWAEHWAKRNLDGVFGPRLKSDHNYPDYFAQAEANPQQIWFYPVAALGEFRTWMFNTYLPESFPKYIDRKVSQALLSPSAAEFLIDAIVPKQLAAGDRVNAP